MAQHDTYRIWLEKVGVVDRAQLDPLFSFLGVQGYVEFRFGLAEFRRTLDGFYGQPGKLYLVARNVAHVEKHLKEGRTAQIALGLELLHQLLEGKVLVIVGSQ